MTAAALPVKIKAAATAARAIDDHLNDPDGDGSGNGAQSPDGDSYNELWGAFDALFELVPRAE